MFHIFSALSNYYKCHAHICFHQNCSLCFICQSIQHFGVLQEVELGSLHLKEFHSQIVPAYSDPAETLVRICCENSIPPQGHGWVSWCSLAYFSSLSCTAHMCSRKSKPCNFFSRPSPLHCTSREKSLFMAFPQCIGRQELIIKWSNDAGYLQNPLEPKLVKDFLVSTLVRQMLFAEKWFLALNHVRRLRHCEEAAWFGLQVLDWYD